MREFDGATTIRRTEYGYDAARRLVQVGFDNDGNGTVDQTVTYDYDRGGLRTQMTLPGNLTITYTYDQRGQLLSLTDWDNQPTRYSYDAAGRLVSMERPNEIHSVYTYDPASRLKQLRHARRDKVLGHFAYTVDARGNRTKAIETLPRPTTSPTAITSSHAAVDYYRGTWITSDLFKETINPTAAMRLMFFGKQVTLTLGVGPDHGICDIYVDHTLWQSIDSYAAAPGEESTIVINLADEGPHLLDIRNRADKNLANTTPSGYKLRFKQLAFASGSRVYDLHSVDYTYDALARLSSAKYCPAANVAATPFREYAFSYDRAGNRTQQIETVSGTPTTTTYTYDTTNRLSQIGGQSVDYDNAGRLTDDNTLTYTWDRANRLLSAGGSSYRYNGVGQRVDQTVSNVVTEYLHDTQPSLYKVLAATTGVVVDRFVHGPTGIQAQQDSSNNWGWMLQDGLGSVRSVLDDNADVLHMSQYAPYGTPWGEQGTAQTPFGFTGEPTDQNDLVHLRARYYNPTLGVFPSLDPLDGSLNRYAYVNGNPINRIDQSGLIAELPDSNCGHHSPTTQGCNGSMTFTYSGSKAALRAITLSRQLRMGFRDSGFQGPPTGRAFNSANFISQSLFAGGLPMTNPDPSYFDSGWYASLDSLGTQRVGNSVWMNHSGDYEGQLANDTRLIGYLSGSALAGSDKAWGFVGKVYSVNIRDVFNVGPNGLPMLDPSPYPPGLGTVKDVQALQELMSALRGVGIGKGDYIFIDAPNEGDIRAPHGFIIVGEGPAVSCDDDYLNEGALHLNLGISDSTLGALPQVFYVADDSGRPPSHKQRPTPRPFYCSRFKVGGNDPNIPGSFDTQLFVHDRWDFYKIPTTLTIPCDRIYRDPDGSIPKADNSIIIE